MNAKRVGIAIDDWKLPIFERWLNQYGYEFINSGNLSPGVLLLKVTTTNVVALRKVVDQATAEAARTGRQ